MRAREDGFVGVLDFRDDHDLALPLAFRFGHAVPAMSVGGRGILSAYRNASLPECVSLRRLAADSLSPERIAELVTDLSLHPYDFSRDLPLDATAITILNLTRIGLRPSEPAHRYCSDDGPPPERSQRDESYFRRALVIGAPSSLPACAWLGICARKAHKRGLNGSRVGRSRPKKPSRS
jgi:hypothetical protein